jgi:SOS-response transcriptional repressor LexA
MRTNTLTARENDVLLAIEDFIKENRFSPSQRELAVMLKWKSVSTANQYLNQLKKAGYVTWDEGCPRTLRLIRKAQLV